MYPTITLNPGREKSIRAHHPWIFSGAIKEIPADLANGEIIYLSDGENIIATGLYSNKSMISVRIMDFLKTEIDEKWILEKMKIALEKRHLLGYGKKTDTTGFRLIHSESDNFPGLIIDYYDGVIVLQISVAGMEKLKPLIVEALKKLLKPKGIIEKNEQNFREKEGTKPGFEILYGKSVDLQPFKENGLKFYSAVKEGQKTGYFLDQKDLRKEIMKYAKGAKVLNLFSYSGAFGVYAVKAGAKSVQNVDSSDFALDLCKKHAKLNKIEEKCFKIENADIFQYLSEKTDDAVPEKDKYDMVILDPPALIKSQKDLDNGIKAYHFLNRAALKLVKKGGIFVTSSCSQFFTEEFFSKTLQKASVQAGCNLTILATIRQSADHPVSIYFPQSFYLKSFVGYVD